MTSGEGGEAARMPPGTIKVATTTTQHTSANIAHPHAPAAGSLATLAATLPGARRAGDEIARAAQEAAAAAALCRQGQYRAAIPRYALAVRLDPSNPDYHYYFACAAWS